MSRLEFSPAKFNAISATATVAISGFLSVPNSTGANPKYFHSFQRVPKQSGNYFKVGLDITVSSINDPTMTGGEVFIFPETTDALNIVRGSVVNNNPSYKAAVNIDGSAIQYGFSKTPDVMSVEFIYSNKLTRFCVKAVERVFLPLVKSQKQEICWNSPK